MSLLTRAAEADVPGYEETLGALFDPRPQAGVAPTHRRKKLWEVGETHHCAVVGTCLTVVELRKLARHAGMEDWETITDYTLHHSAVHHARERNALSALMQKEIERKFRLAVRRCAAVKRDADLSALWRDAVACGDVAGMLWAVVTHPAVSEGTLNVISGELHMLSHQTGAASRADLQRLAALEHEKRDLREQLRRQQGKVADDIRQKNASITALEQRAAQAVMLEHRLQETEARLRTLEHEGALAQARRQLAAETARAQRAEERAGVVAQIEARCAQLEAELAESHLECEALERVLHQALTRPTCRGRPQGECASDLAGRCVLYVGGRTGLVDHYRVLVEQCRGRFVHHDGGIEDNVKRLQPLLASADCVVCASGNVSHGAYYIVKRYCKQDGKPCVLLKKASLASFASGIRALAGGAANARDGDTVLVADRHQSTAVSAAASCID